MIKNLVLSGGELKGLSYVGVLRFLEEVNLLKDIKNILGVSAGALFGLAYALKFTSSQLKQLVLSLNIYNLKHLESESIFDFFESYGLDSGVNIERMLKIIIKKKLGNENATFEDLYNYNPDKNLIILGTNLNKCKRNYYSYRDTPNMYLWEAIRISVSYPIYFKSVMKNGEFLVDGGLLGNYPIDYFKDDLDNTIGIALDETGGDVPIDSLDKYLVKLIYCITTAYQNYIINEYSKNTIIIRLNYNFFSLDFSDSIKNYLIDEGYNQFREQYSILTKDNSRISEDIDETNNENEDDISEIIDDIKSEISKTNSIDEEILMILLE